MRSARFAKLVAALLFRLPMPSSAYAICENQIRGHVAAELAALDTLKGSRNAPIE